MQQIEKRSTQTYQLLVCVLLGARAVQRFLAGLSAHYVVKHHATR